jgi:hypothetical protein
MTRRNLLTNAWVQLILVFLVLVGVNTWSFDHFKRLDLTEDRLHSLDLQTRALVYRVDKPLLTKVYFSEGLCFPHQNHRARVVDTLEELQAYSHGLMELEFIDPTGDPELIDQARRFGIESFEGEYNCGDREEKRDVFMGISMLYGDRQEVLTPVLNLDRLEYDLAIALKRLVAGEDPKRIGWATGHGELGLLNREVHRGLAQLRTELSKEFILEAVPLGGEGPIDESIDLLFLVEPRTTLSNRALYQLDQFIMRGGAAAIYLTNYAPHPRAPMRAQRFYHGLEPLLEHYGVQVNRDMVVDRKHYQLDTPLAPEVKTFHPEHITVQKVESLLFPFASTLTLTDPDSERVEATILASTEPTSGAIREIESVNPKDYQTAHRFEERGSYPVLVALEGTWTSFYADKEIPLPDDGTDAVPDDPSSKLRESPRTRIVVGGSSTALWFGATNQQVTRNLADWMAEDESLIGIRGKTHTLATFEPLEPDRAKRLKMFNLLGGVGLMFGLGLAIWARRTRPWASTASSDTPWARLKSGLQGRDLQLSTLARGAGQLLRPRPKTLALVGIGAAVLVPAMLEDVDLFGGEASELQNLNSGLPILSAVPRESIQRIEITSVHEQIVLEQEITAEQREVHELGSWSLSSPIESEADIASIRTLVSTFRKETPIDARLEQGNLAEYGLDANNRLVVEVFTDSEEPALSYVLGFDVAGSNGATYLKLSGSDDVYRANIGGRARFQKKGTDWRNRVIMGFELDEAATVEVLHTNGSTLSLHLNEESRLWEITEAPADMVVDQELVASTVKSLGTLRAGAFLGRSDEGFNPPRATVQVTLSDGETRELDIGSTQLEGAALVRNPKNGESYRVSNLPIQALLQAPTAFENLAIMRFDSSRVTTLEYRQGTALIKIQQDMGAKEGYRTWVPLIPSNYSLELKRTFAMVNTLKALRAEERSNLTPQEAGILQSEHWIRITFLNGQQLALVVGNETRNERGGPAWFVAPYGSSQVFVISNPLLSKLKAGFGR